MEDKEMLIKPKFPHSTESTLVTLKGTRSFHDIPFHYDGEAIEEEQNQNKEKSSKNSKGSNILEVISMEGSVNEDRMTKSIKLKRGKVSKVMGDL